MMVFSELKGHKDFKGHKVPFKVTREAVVMEEQQVTSVLRGPHQVLQVLQEP
jgi:hypothetical protein